MGCPAAAERVCLRSRSRRCSDAACPCFARSGCSSYAHDVYATGRALLRQEARPFSALAALISSASDRAIEPAIPLSSASSRLRLGLESLAPLHCSARGLGGLPLLDTDCERETESGVIVDRPTVPVCERC